MTKATRNTQQNKATGDLVVVNRSRKWASDKTAKALAGRQPLTAEQHKTAKAYVDKSGMLPDSGKLARVIDFEPQHDKPRAVRKGSKSDIMLALASRECGATLYEIADALSKTGSYVSPSYARAWAARSYVAPIGYGMTSAAVASPVGVQLVIYAYVSDKALSSADGAKASSTRRDTAAGRKREPHKPRKSASKAKSSQPANKPSQPASTAQSGDDKPQAASTAQSGDDNKAE